jgi:hypothetical protein
MQLAGEHGARGKPVVYRRDRDPVRGQRGQPSRAVVGLVAAAPSAAVDVDSGWRVVERCVVDVERELKSIVGREDKIPVYLSRLLTAPFSRGSAYADGHSGPGTSGPNG